jgi:lysozyme
MVMELSEGGLRFIARCEAYRGKPYKDGSYWRPGSPRWATGYGHTIPEGEHELKRWTDNLSHQDAMDLFKVDLAPRVSSVNKLCAGVPLNQNQFDAIVSFVFNAGEGALKKSTLLIKLKKLDYEGASAEFPKWNKWTNPQGALEVSKGLVLRRKLERDLFDLPTKEPVEAILERALWAQFDLGESLLCRGPIHPDE